MSGLVCTKARIRASLGPLRSAALLAAALALAAGLPPQAKAQEQSALSGIQQRGTLRVALYKNFAPFSDNGKGADVDLAEALAAKLGVKMTALWFDADDSMEDDLRNMVWKGHYLGYGPADVMMHVPIDREYMAKIDRVSFVAPYHRERYAIARNLEKLPALDSFDPFEKLPLGVEGDTLAATVMLSTESGRYRGSLRTFKTGQEVVAALKSGAVAAALAQQGELEAGIKADSRFGIDPAPNPLLQKRQWVLGLAVRAQSEDLAQALQKAVSELLADGTVKRIMERNGVQHRQP